MPSSTTSWSLESSKWRNVSEPAKDLIRALLTKDPKKRISSLDILGERPSCMRHSIATATRMPSKGRCILHAPVPLLPWSLVLLWHKNTGTQEHRSTGTQEHRNTGTCVVHLPPCKAPSIDIFLFFLLILIKGQTPPCLSRTFPKIFKSYARLFTYLTTFLLVKGNVGPIL